MSAAVQKQWAELCIRQAVYDRAQEGVERQREALGAALVAELRAIIGAGNTAVFENHRYSARAHLRDRTALSLRWGDTGGELSAIVDGHPVFLMRVDVNMSAAETLPRFVFLLEEQEVGTRNRDPMDRLARVFSERTMEEQVERLGRAAAQLRPLLPTEAASVEPGAPS
jgi:hypothetical protein